ncbi:type VI secretion system membrane subunit TssM [Comamonas composti]|uniref:type VI secretion system membrane subunit TssM n=1 Tax=Comamonas composti TaxID=408558 RepID=UPI00316AD4B2
MIWFVGPLIAIGNSQPLLSAEVRVATIVLLCFFILFFLLRWPLYLLLAFLLSMLVWYVGPTFRIGSIHPLESVAARILCMVLIWVVALVYAAYRFWKMLRNDQDFVKKIFSSSKAEKPVLAKEEIKTLDAGTQRVLMQLRKMHGRQGLKGFMDGSRYLYELPWYMLVGSPGAGKTTALLNSGLSFPIADQMGAASVQMTLANNAGTINCNWWFTNEAVMIDTAGRYTCQSDGSTGMPEPEEGGELDQIDVAEVVVSADNSRHRNVNAAEWLGFLGILRKYRARAPLNGVLLVVDVGELLQANDQQRTMHAAQIKSRLLELREHLHIRFPVYVLITKMDLLRGFGEYFHALTSEGRGQVLGFTLPLDLAAQTVQGHSASGKAVSRMQAACMHEMQLLSQRLEDGINARLQEEFDADRRRLLYALPQEFEALTQVVGQWLELVFNDSRFDITEKGSSLRGVYFTSATQTGDEILAKKTSLFARVRSFLGERSQADGRQQGARSFFLAQLFRKVIFQEAGMVRPNYRWELRYRFVRLLGHFLLAVVFVWALLGMWSSFGNNTNYLQLVSARVDKLLQEVSVLVQAYKPENSLTALDAARPLAYINGLDLQDPPLSYRYGLYSALPVVDAADRNYTALQSNLLLPVIAGRMEAVLRQSIANQDHKFTYDTLAVYLMLSDPKHYKAAELRRWVLNDWQNGYYSALAAGEGTGAAVFGNKASFMPHIESMFSDGKLVQMDAVRDQNLVEQARSFLNASSTSQRLYQRVRSSLQSQAPADFTLVTAVGPQVATVFRRAQGMPLEKGVPGFFTYDGYHKLFSAKVGEIIQSARGEDSWVMGQQAEAMSVATPLQLTEVDALVDDVRRQYLEEYASQWKSFLESVRPLTGDSLAFDINVVRQLAAPDSPLSRLARAAARETTLSRPLVSAQKNQEEQQGLLEQASKQLDKKIADAKRNLGLQPQAILERQLVDNQFGALREIVTGKTEIGGVEASSSKSQTGLETVNALINEYYATLVIANTSLGTNTAPSTNAETATRLRLEADKLPPPFKEVLQGIVQSGAEKVERETADILRAKALVELERINTAYTNQVLDFCRKGIEGRYPFVASTQEVAIEDFNAMFSAGGILDTFLTRELQPYVDTSTQPWRFKSPEQASIAAAMQSPATSQAAAAFVQGPTLQSELLKLLQQQGPRLQTFSQAQKIREVFFQEPGARKLAWKMDMRIEELDPNITDLYLDIDGQSQHYAHGPVQALAVKWPGPRGGYQAELSGNPRIRPETSAIMARGPWALMRLLEKASLVNTASSGRTVAVYLLDGRKVALGISSGSYPNPLSSDLLRTFKCS